jgi:hypothetical protein
MSFVLGGVSLLSGYYSVWDNSDKTNAKIGFAPTPISTKVNIQTDVTPKNTQNFLLWELTMFGSFYRSTYTYLGSTLYWIFYPFGYLW